MRTNTAPPSAAHLHRTHEGTTAQRLTPEEELRRAVMSCLLWEDNFYESGEHIAQRIRSLVPKVRPEAVSEIAISARTQQHLRHAPLFLARELARNVSGSLVGRTISSVIQRPDELAEFLSIYWVDGKSPLSKQVKLGLATAFRKFGEYELAKYNRDNAIKLRDVLFLCHAKPKDAAQDALWKRLINDQLSTPDTWEVALSSGADKAETFTRLLSENKLGGLALLRNLRNMIQARVPSDLIRHALLSHPMKRVLPFRFISAAKYAPQFEPELEAAMFRSLAEVPKLPGKTALVVDTSPSMWGTKVSSRSELDRFEAAAALAILIREICEIPSIYAFNYKAYIIPPRRGFALRDSLAQTQEGSSCGNYALRQAARDGYDRIIVLTDGQWHRTNANADPLIGRFSYTFATESSILSPSTPLAYMVNLHSYQTGVGYGEWTTINGWSEAIVQYISAREAD